jgi:hypothetical protein
MQIDVRQAVEIVEFSHTVVTIEQKEVEIAGNVARMKRFLDSCAAL